MEMSQSKDPLKNWRPFQLSTISPYHLEWVLNFETHPDLDYLQDGIKKHPQKENDLEIDSWETKADK